MSIRSRGPDDRARQRRPLHSLRRLRRRLSRRRLRQDGKWRSRDRAARGLPDLLSLRTLLPSRRPLRLPIQRRARARRRGRSSSARPPRQLSPSSRLARNQGFAESIATSVTGSPNRTARHGSVDRLAWSRFAWRSSAAASRAWRSRPTRWPQTCARFPSM